MRVIYTEMLRFYLDRAGLRAAAEHGAGAAAMLSRTAAAGAPG
jgi:hypothetical protein